ncbi:hypothetical protein MLD38_036009 [Melastoma candidum]|uniref:Uncharacterized protein n=1 Tax=Melastoma candidum TaxID=119954 RepID=A0ACB9LJA0_9MYRT|nr:hypothetical protein MLD38_036009 [Melastoma candidum]
MAREVSNRSVSPDRGRSSPRRKSSPRRHSSQRERSPHRHMSSRGGASPSNGKYSSRAKSPEHKRSISPVSRSPSPRTKRLKRALAGKESEKSHERNERKREEKGVRERGTDKEIITDRREKRNGRDEVDKEFGVERRDRRNEKYEDDRAGGNDKRDRRIEWDGDDRDKGRERREEGQRRNDRIESNGRSSRSRQGRPASPPDRQQRRQRSLSPEIAADHREVKNGNEDDQGDYEDDSMAKMKAAEMALEEKQKQQPSFELSGKLAAETNRVRGITLLFNEPPEARKPDIRWRLYVFKGGEALNEPLYIHRQSCYLFGRERRIADVPTDHPSCSKQHAVIQFRQVEKEQPDGMMKKQIRHDLHPVI